MGESDQIDISGLICEFLHRYNLKKQYVANLPKTDQCIGCGRDGGDHDMECPTDAEWWFDGSVGHATTNSSYEEQVASLVKWMERK